ncbi:hypothetical protein QYE76_019610 [Lolium multiflorum]|uniref:Uncharacterized protein n=1 Tax=Lolium multiflorum TaxID=4521 RepID=A0AAD8R3C7_LOLMU|nr:hypothetical protein QYE76_019610 [Lolium multiflorum]
MEHHIVVRTKKPHVLRAMVKLAVDRSHGQIESFAGADFVTDELLTYIAQRSFRLKKLSLSSCNVSNQGFLDLITSSPLLEELFINMCDGITN